MSYINNWAINAKQHFEDGDYEWVCEQIRPYKRVIEIGCGAGYSTLAFLLNDFDVFALDFSADALSATKALIMSNGYDIDENHFLHLDTVHQINKVRDAVARCDIAVLCNPGGNLEVALTNGELRLLQIGNFSDDEINHSNLNLLHKWAQIFGACGAASLANKPIQIVDRFDSEEEAMSNLEQIAIDMELRLVNTAFRVIRGAPEGGVLIKSGYELVWGAGLYFP